MISIIAAISLNHVIGNNGSLPWRRIHPDMKHFYDKTVNNTVIMGRRTFLEDLKGNALYSRQNIVLTQQSDELLSPYTDIEVVHTPRQALDSSLNDVYVIGGRQVYNAFLPIASRLYITHVLDTYYGDTYFPALDFSDYNLINSVRHEICHINTYESIF